MSLVFFFPSVVTRLRRLEGERRNTTGTIDFLIDRRDPRAGSSQRENTFASVGTPSMRAEIPKCLSMRYV